MGVCGKDPFFNQSLTRVQFLGRLCKWDLGVGGEPGDSSLPRPWLSGPACQWASLQICTPAGSRNPFLARGWSLQGGWQQLWQAQGATGLERVPGGALLSCL